MAYLTAAQFFLMVDARVGQALSGDQNSPYGNPAGVTEALDTTASVIDGYLSGRVATVPVPSGSSIGLLRLLNARLAQFELHARRPNVPKEVAAGQKWATDWLEMFAKGMVQLPGVDRAAVPKLHVSDSLSGASRFSHIYGLSPSDTAPDHD